MLSLSESKLGLEEEEGYKVHSENTTMPLSMVSRRGELLLKLQHAAFIGLLFGLWNNG